MPEKHKYTASHYPARLVWLLSIIALCATAIMLIVVWWTMVDIRTEQERFDALKGKFTEIRTRLMRGLDVEKWEITTILSPESVSHPGFSLYIGGDTKKSGPQPPFFVYC